MLIRKSLHILLAFLVWISSTGLITHLHYCKSELANISFYLLPDPCPEETVKVSCHAHMQHKEQPAPKGCCDDETDFVKINVEQAAHSFQLDPPPLEPVSLGLLFAKQVPIIKNGDSATPHYLNYKPPLLIYELHIRLETFLC